MNTQTAQSNEERRQVLEEEVETELVKQIETSTTELLNRSEIEQQISTARKFPRSLRNFNVQCREMATLTPQVAAECTYSLPRGKKWITGPSARFAEIVMSAWGNCRAGARVIGEEGEFVVAQGAFHDLEKNVAITYEVRRRIVDKDGERFNTDMIGVTSNAACSIALRNAVLKGVPKAYWEPAWINAKETATGNSISLADARQKALKEGQAMGISAEQVCTRLGVAGIADIGIDELIALQGLLNAIREGETELHEVFPGAKPHKKKGSSVEVQAETSSEKKEATAKSIEKITKSEVNLVIGLAKKRGMNDEALMQFLFGNFNIENGPANITADILDDVCRKLAEKM